MRRATLLSILMLFFVADLCGCALRARGERREMRRVTSAQEEQTIQNSGPTDPIVVKAEMLIAGIRGRMIVTSALVIETQNQVESLQALPPKLNASYFNLNAVQSAMKECWNTPLNPSGDFEPLSIDYAQIPPNTSSIDEKMNLAQTQLALSNAYETVDSCDPPSLKAAQKLKPRSPQYAFTFVSEKIQLVDAIRILLDRVPSRLEDEVSALSSASQQIVMIALDVQNDPKRSQKDKAQVTNRLNQMMDVELREMEFALNEASASVGSALDELQEQVESVLFARPLFNLRE